MNSQPERRQPPAKQVIPALPADPIELRANSYADTVRERDLDHFLIEELQASPEFRDWFIEHLDDGFSAPSDGCIRTQRSPSRITDGRQTDVWLAYYDSNNQVVAAVLIESKVANGFQLNKAEDYAREVAAWRAKLGHRQAAGTLVAPRNNLRLGTREHFDSFVAVEDVAEFLKARRERLPQGELCDRLRVRIDMLEALAGKRANSQWNPQPIVEKVSLGEVYDRLVRAHLPNYRVSPWVAGKHSGDRFFKSFPGRSDFNGSVHLKHRLYGGVVCLEFRGTRLSEATLKELLPRDDSIRLCWTGRLENTLQLQMRVPALGLSACAVDESSIVQALDAVKRLVHWFRQNAGAMKRIVEQSGR